MQTRLPAPSPCQPAMRGFGILLLSYFLALSGAALACGPSPGGPPGACASAVAGTGDSGGPEAGAGNPINVITGNKYQREEDLPALPGVLGLEIVRHYNSAYSKPGAPNGPMGREWKLSYETELFDRFGRIQILQADGTRIIFERDPRNPQLCGTALPAHGRMTLGRQANGAPDYTWTLPDGRRLHFNAWGKLDTITAATGDTLSLFYDRDNLLLKVIDPQGRGLHLRYLDRGTAMSGKQFGGVRHIDSPVGRYSYDYGSAAPPGAPPFDRRIVLANLLRVRLPAAGPAAPAVSRLYHHEDPRFPWLLTGISIETAAADGQRAATRYATFGYDDNGRANLSTHAGNVGKITLDTREGGTTVLTNSLGQRTVYRHAIVGGQQRLLEVRGAGCATCGETNVRYGYDKLGQLTETTRLDAGGAPVSTLRRELDRLGRTVRIGQRDDRNGKPGPMQWRLRLEYAGERHTPSVVSRPSVVPGKEKQSHIAYNRAGQVLSITESGWRPGQDGQQAAALVARTTTYRYATLGGRSVLARIDGPLPNGKTGSPLDSDVTVFEYDGVADANDKKQAGTAGKKPELYDEREARRDAVLTAIIAPGNIRSTFTHDAAGRIASVTDAAGVATQFAYLPQGQLLRRTQAGLRHEATFDALGNPVELFYRHSNDTERRAVRRMGYDAAGRLLWSASHLGILNSWRRDTENRLLDATTASAAIRQTRSYTYDALGRLLSTTDANGARWRLGWNARGLPETLSDALGRITRYRHDAEGRIVGVTPLAHAPAAPHQDLETRFELDVNGDTGSVTAPDGATTRYLRDDFGQLIATISPASGTTRRQFDAAGRLSASTDAKGNRATYAYDAAGRIVRQVIGDASAMPAQRNTVTTWRYAGARLAAIDHPQQAERYSHDAQGRLTDKRIILTLDDGSQASYRTRYRYDTLGQLAGLSLPDGSLLDFRRNGQRQVVAIERHAVHLPWLRWLLPRQTMVSDLRRDAAGLQRITYGNGIEASYQRSAEGTLARVLYRDPRRDPPAPPPGPANALAAAPAASGSGLPGALGLPPDPAALLDHRYLWDAQGNLLHAGGPLAASSYVYDSRDRLIAAATVSPGATQPASFARYHYDAEGNRLLAQEEVASQSDLQRHTVRTAYAGAARRWQGDGTDDAAYDAAGQPQHIGPRRYRWDALGKLTEVSQGTRPLARYRYNHRGQRIAKQARGKRTYYLYNDDRTLLAELDASGAVTRQYVYLAGQPVALIDTAGRIGGTAESATPLARAMADLKTIWHAWRGRGGAVAFLHTNHLGATERITGAGGKAVWQASYAPFGALRAATPPDAFEFNLRLPGQYADRETGLYYNDQRYYDPRQGRYLTPDPLGLRAGANAYAYVDGNPLKYVDPGGLILLAFDGTGNSRNPAPDSAISNVVKFYEAYDQIQNGKAFYITGIGTTNEDMPYAGSAITGDGFDQRVTLGLRFLDKFIETDAATGMLDIDVVGFSRGAAEARVFINVLIEKMNNGANGAYTIAEKSRCLNLRFEGLWDTVPHLGELHGDETQYDFAIPAAVKYAVHAVALNEHRGSLTDFDLLSIMDTPGQASAANRIEKAFIGSHSDIGGGFGTGDLSDVALMWMIEQAREQGIAIADKKLDDNQWSIVTNPIVHDRSGNRYNNGNIAITRYVGYGNKQEILQTDAVFDGKRTSDTTDFIHFFPNPYACGSIANPDIGLVDMTQYTRWLANFGLSMATGPIVNTSCKAPS